MGIRQIEKWLPNSSSQSAWTKLQAKYVLAKNSKISLLLIDVLFLVVTQFAAYEP